MGNIVPALLLYILLYYSIRDCTWNKTWMRFLTTLHICARSVMSDPLWSFGLQPTRILCPWDFSGKNTWEGYHFLLQGLFPSQGSNPHLLPPLHFRQFTAEPLSKPSDLIRPKHPNETYGLDVLRRMCAICRHLAPRGKKRRTFFLFLFFSSNWPVKWIIVFPLRQNKFSFLNVEIQIHMRSMDNVFSLNCAIWGGKCEYHQTCINS